jgi:hypothetical protein
MDLIWANREAKYFFDKDWTVDSALFGNGKFAFWRKGRKAGFAPKRSLRAKAFFRSIALPLAVKRAVLAA